MTFDVAAGSYDRFMGRYSQPLAVEFAEWVQVRRGQRTLDVGCGPGALTAELVRRLGAEAVCAIDPSESFVEAVAKRCPGVDVRHGVAEKLPCGDGVFDRSLAQLVVHFMADPVQGLQEMARVTRPGGVVAACVWDHAGDGGPLSLFWRAVRDLDGTEHGESDLAGARKGDLARLFAEAGLKQIDETVLTVRVRFADVDDWWEPFLLGVGPAGAYASGLDEGDRARLRRRCVQLLPPAPFEITASAWTVRARLADQPVS